MKISIKVNNTIIKKELKKAESAESILKNLNIETNHQILLCKVDNSYRGLSHLITRDCTIEYLDMTNNYACAIIKYKENQINGI